MSGEIGAASMFAQRITRFVKNGCTRDSILLPGLLLFCSMFIFACKDEQATQGKSALAVKQSGGEWSKLNIEMNATFGSKKLVSLVRKADGSSEEYFRSPSSNSCSVNWRRPESLWPADEQAIECYLDEYRIQLMVRCALHNNRSNAFQFFALQNHTVWCE